MTGYLTFAVVVYCLGRLAVTFFDQLEDSTATSAIKMVICVIAGGLILVGAISLSAPSLPPESLQAPAKAVRTAPRR